MMYPNIEDESLQEIISFWSKHPDFENFLNRSDVIGRAVIDIIKLAKVLDSAYAENKQLDLLYAMQADKLIEALNELEQLREELENRRAEWDRLPGSVQDQIHDLMNYGYPHESEED